jgi:hypothetical protein
VTDQDVFPSDAAFPKAFEAKNRPGLKEASQKEPGAAH